MYVMIKNYRNVYIHKKKDKDYEEQEYVRVWGKGCGYNLMETWLKIF